MVLLVGPDLGIVLLPGGLLHLRHRHERVSTARLMCTIDAEVANQGPDRPIEHHDSGLRGFG